jgi:hypothetical protein
VTVLENSHLVVRHKKVEVEIRNMRPSAALSLSSWSESLQYHQIVLFSMRPDCKRIGTVGDGITKQTATNSSAQRGGYSFFLEILEDHSLDTRP